MSKLAGSPYFWAELSPDCSSSRFSLKRWRLVWANQLKVTLMEDYSLGCSRPRIARLGSVAVLLCRLHPSSRSLFLLRQQAFSKSWKLGAAPDSPPPEQT